MKKAFRISYWRYCDDEKFKQHIEFIRRYNDCIDEIALFTDYSHHIYFPLEHFHNVADILINRMDEYRKAGIKSVGLNVLCTLGHGNEGWEVLPKPPFQTMVGPDGSSATSCLCPNTEEYKKYIAEKYRIFAETKPDFIWVDDDIRMIGHGVSHACFCDTCINLFNQEYSCSYTRQTLVNELNSPEGGKARENWTEHNNKTLHNLLAYIEKVVHEVSPDINTGLMTFGLENLSYSGVNYSEWMDALKAEKGRPGGGFYDDNTPLNFMCSKALSCASQVSAYSKNVNDIQYEFEDFPYQKLLKSMAISNLECVGALMNGCNGIAFNAICFEDYPELLEMVKKKKAQWETADSIGKSFRNVGMYALYHTKYDARRPVTNGNWFDGGNGGAAANVNYTLCEIGIPIADSMANAAAFALTGRMADGFTDDEIRDILTHGVIMDGTALEILIGRGFGDYCGVSIDKKMKSGVYEVFTDDEINGDFASYRRDIYMNMSYAHDDFTYSFKAEKSGVRTIANLYTLLGENLGPAFTLYENKYGGRIAVTGYTPFKYLQSEEKRAQIIHVCDWLSHDELPAKIDKCLKTVIYAKKSKENGDMLLMLTNCSYDLTGRFELTVRCSGRKVYIIDTNGKEALQNNIDFSRQNEIAIGIQNINAWDYLLLHITGE